MRTAPPRRCLIAGDDDNDDNNSHKKLNNKSSKPELPDNAANPNAPSLDPCPSATLSCSAAVHQNHEHRRAITSSNARHWWRPTTAANIKCSESELAPFVVCEML